MDTKSHGDPLATPTAHIRSSMAVIEALLRAIESENDADG